LPARQRKVTLQSVAFPPHIPVMRPERVEFGQLFLADSAPDCTMSGIP
jgi:hypothetical protein